MDLVVICADCRAEFKASGDLARWKCTSCGREAENKQYPFLTRRVAHAKSHRGETNWEEMFDEVLAAAHEKVLALEARIAKLEGEQGRPRASKR
jgi:protein-arginine kinase activator protein McsA